MDATVRKLSRNTLIVTIGKISTQFVSFLLLPLYTSILNNEQYGVVDLLQTLSTLLLPIVSFQLEQAVFRYLTVSKKSKEQSQIISTAFFGVLIQSIIYVLLACFICMFIDSSYKYFLIFNVVAQTWSGFLLQIPRSFGNYTRYALGSIIIGISSILLNIILIVIIPLGAFGMLIAACIGNVLGCIFIFYNIKLHKFLRFKNFNKDLYREFLRYSIPMIPSHLSWWIINAADRVIISSFLNISFNGIYAAAMKLPSIFNIAVGILNVTWTETLVSSSSDSHGMENSVKIFKRIVKLIFCAGILMLLLLPLAFKLLINEKFNEAYNLIPILVIGTVASSLATLSASFYIVKKDTKRIAKTSLFAAIINILVHLLLISYIGLYAAAISTAISQIVLAGQRFIGIREIINLKISFKIIIFTAIVGFINLFYFYNINVISLSISILITSVYILYLNWDIVKYIKNKKITTKN